MLRRGAPLMVALLILAVFAAGCAKRPATTQVSSAPAPTGAATTTPAPRQPPRHRRRVNLATAAPTPGSGSTAAPAPAPRRRAALAEGIHRRRRAARTSSSTSTSTTSAPSDAKILDANAAWLKANAEHLVLIEGHCDERGTNEYNLALGERRAKSTMNYLVAQGIQASRITIISYGKERPVCTEKTEDCWAKNRRAHFLVKPR